MASGRAAQLTRRSALCRMCCGPSDFIGCSRSTYASISIPHSDLRTFLDRRVTDGVIRRMIDKWLKAGAVEDGLLCRMTEGSPQGGVISHPASRTSSCTTCWTNGSRPRCGRVSRGIAPLSASLTTRSWHSTTLSMLNASWRCWASVLLVLGSRSIRTRVSDAATGPLRFALGCKLHNSFPSDDGIAAGIACRTKLVIMVGLDRVRCSGRLSCRRGGRTAGLPVPRQQRFQR
jgi:hypothetical protein